MAGKITIAEVEELYEAGELNPDEIHTPGIYVNRIFKGSDYEKRIEQMTTRLKAKCLEIHFNSLSKRVIYP